MALIIIGILLLAAALSLQRMPELKRFGNPALGIAGLLILLGVISASVVQVDVGYIGIQKLFGKVQNGVLYPGLHFINPFMDVIKTETRTQNYTMSATHNEGNKTGDDAIRVLSADGLEVVLDLTVLYRIVATEAPRVLGQTGLDYEDKIVRPLARTIIRNNAVYYDAVSLYSSKRDEFQNRVVTALEAEFKARGLLLENLLIRNITLPALVKTAIEQKIQAEQEAQKMQFVLQKERQEADRKRVEAQGIADYQKIVNANLTDKQLQYEQIKAMKELAASDNAKLIIMGKGGNPVILDTK